MEISARKWSSFSGIFLFSLILVIVAEMGVLSLVSSYNFLKPYENYFYILVFIVVPVLVFQYFYSTSIGLIGDRIIIRRFLYKKEILLSELTNTVFLGESKLFVLWYRELNPLTLYLYTRSSRFPKSFYLPAFDGEELNKLIIAINSKLPKSCGSGNLRWDRQHQTVDQFMIGFVIFIFVVLVPLVVIYAAPN